MEVHRENTFFDMSNKYVKVVKMGHITEITYSQKRNTKINIKKINKNEYVKLSTRRNKQI